MGQEEIRLWLSSSQSRQRLKAVRQIRETRDESLLDDMYQAYLRERTNSRTWEVQANMIRVLGELNYLPALSTIKEICLLNKPHDEITRSAATSYVRIERCDLLDASPVVAMLVEANQSLMMGLFDALGYDKMVPPPDQIRQILTIVNSKSLIHPKGTGDPRYGLAAAAAGWPLALTQDFLQDCLRTNDTPLRYVAANSLKGKYVKLR